MRGYIFRDLVSIGVRGLTIVYALPLCQDNKAKGGLATAFLCGRGLKSSPRFPYHGESFSVRWRAAMAAAAGSAAAAAGAAAISIAVSFIGGAQQPCVNHSLLCSHSYNTSYDWKG